MVVWLSFGTEDKEMGINFPPYWCAERQVPLALAKTDVGRKSIGGNKMPNEGFQSWVATKKCITKTSIN